jgi:Mg-chelatase subunit ChlD
MKDENSNSLEPVGDESIEARIVAWVLGDASTFEAAELERLCEERPELLVFRRRMEALHGLLGESEKVPADEWKLPAEKRARLEELFGSPAAGERTTLIGKTRRQPWLRQTLMAVAACVALAAGFQYVFQPSGRNGVAKAESKELSMALGKRQAAESPVDFLSSTGGGVGYTSSSPVLPPIASQAPLAAAPPLASRASGLKADRLLTAQSGKDRDSHRSVPPDISLEEELYTQSRMGDRGGNTQPAAGAAAGDSFQLTDAFARGAALPNPLFPYGDNTHNSRKSLPAEGASYASEGRAYSGAHASAGIPFGGSSDYIFRGELPATPRGDVETPTSPWSEEPQSSAQLAKAFGQPDSKENVRKGLYTGEGAFNLGKLDQAKREFEEVLRADPYNQAARHWLERVKDAKSDYYRAANDYTRAELLAQVDDAWELAVPAEPDAPTGKAKSAPDESGVEALRKAVSQNPAPVPTGETSAAEEPFSTFSLHVSDASFKLSKAALDRGERPTPEQIRVEEFYNAFDYGDEVPAPGEEVACTIEQSAHPILPQRNLVRVAMRVGSTGRGEGQPLNLTILLDKSGSMERDDRHAGLKAAMAQLATLLTPNDTVTLAGFSRTPHLLADRISGAQAAQLVDLVDRLPSEGGTNLEEALKLAGELALQRKNPTAQNRIVLLTDGAANLGDARPELLAQKIAGLRQQGIAFDAAGIGAGGLNDRMLETLTRQGNGRYYVVNDAADADENFARQLAGAFRPTAENVKVQVRFNPARVARYKLIGFEKHRLNKEDFRNDAVDAAELAADEAGVALYQVEVLPEGEGELGEVSVRFRDAAGGGMVDRSWSILHDAKVTSFDQAKPSMQLAGLALLAGEKLRGGPMAEAIDFSSFVPQTGAVEAHYGASPRVRELTEMIRKLR